MSSFSTDVIKDAYDRIAASYRNLLLSLFVVASLLVLTGGDRTFLKVESFVAGLTALQDQSSELLPVLHDSHRRMDDVVSASVASFKTALDTAMEEMGYAADTVDRGAFPKLSGLPLIYSSSSNPNGEEVREQQVSVFPQQLDYWLDVFPVVEASSQMVLAFDHSDPVSAAQSATALAGCQQSVSIAPRCTFTAPSHPLFQHSPTGSVRSIGFFMNYRLTDPTMCHEVSGLQYTPYNYPQFSCQWRSVPKTSYAAIAQKASVTIPDVLLDPPSREELQDVVGDQATVRGLLTEFRKFVAERKVASAFDIRFESRYLELVAAVATAIFAALFVYLVAQLSEYVRRYPEASGVDVPTSAFPPIVLAVNTWFLIASWLLLASVYLVLVGIVLVQLYGLSLQSLKPCKAFGTTALLVSLLTQVVLLLRAFVQCRTIARGVQAAT